MITLPINQCAMHIKLKVLSQNLAVLQHSQPQAGTATDRGTYMAETVNSIQLSI